MTFTRKPFNLNLRYYDTKFSKEDCFVFTGDPNAVPTHSENKRAFPEVSQAEREPD